MVSNSINLRIFLKTFKEALLSYSFSIGGLIAGFMLFSQSDVFLLYPWAFGVYPAVLSARGVISGLFSGHLGTALHIGTINPKVFGNTRLFYVLFESTIFITFLTSIISSFFSVIFGIFFWGISLTSFFEILFVVSATMTFGLILSIFTVFVAFITFKKGFDPDVLQYPIMATIADVFITFFYIFILKFNFVFTYSTALIFVFLLTLSFYVLFRNRINNVFLKIIRESFITLILVALIVPITGTFLKKISSLRMNEVTTIYPSLINVIGSVGSVVGSTTTTKLALGLLSPSFSSIKNHLQYIFSAWSASIIIFSLFSILSLLINGIFNLNTFTSFTMLLLVTNIISVFSIIIISYFISILTFKKGLDPDNFVIPIESSLADSITSIALLVVLTSLI